MMDQRATVSDSWAVRELFGNLVRSKRRVSTEESTLFRDGSHQAKVGSKIRSIVLVSSTSVVCCARRSLLCGPKAT